MTHVSMARVKDSRRPNRRLAVVAGLAVAVLSVTMAGCGAGAEESSDGGGGAIKVAIMNDLTGPIASSQAPGTAGVLTAIEEINADGGVDGRKIEVVGPFDTKSTSEGGAAAAQQAINANPDFIVVGSSGLPLASAMPVLQQAKVPAIAQTAAISLLEPAQPFFYGLGTSGAKGAAAYLNEAARVVGSDPLKVAIIGLNDPGVDASVDALKDAVPGYGGTVVAVERTPGGLSSFTTQAAKIVSSGANVVVAVDAVSNVVVEAKNLGTAGYEGHILSSYSTADDATLSTIDNPNFEAYRFGVALAEGDPVYESALKAKQSSDLITGGTFDLGYALGHIIKTAFADCGDSCGTAEVQKALEAGPITIPGDILYGPIQFSSDSHSGMTAVQYFSWDGAAKKAVAVSPEPVSLELKGQ